MRGEPPARSLYRYEPGMCARRQGVGCVKSVRPANPRSCDRNLRTPHGQPPRTRNGLRSA
jgi:hypothetical protein